MKKFQVLALAAVSALLAGLPAQASSMPKADFARPNLGIGLGNGVSVSVDFPVSREFSLGASVGFPRFNSGGVDVRGLYKLLQGHSDSRLDLDLLLGVQAFGLGSNVPAFAPFAGVALAYPFTSRLTGRLNLAYALESVYSFYDQPSGIELGYRFTPTLEGTIGASGRGDVLGLNLAF
jgi:hypothetical protein